MAQARFVLKEPNSNTETLIYLLFSFNNQRLKYSFKEKINPKFWNSERQRAKETKAFLEYPEFNARLNHIEILIHNIYRRLLNDNIIPTPKLLRDELNEVLTEKQKVNKNVTFIEFIEKQISNSTKRPRTIISYKQALRVLKEYCTEKKTTLTFEDINHYFYNDFINYLRERNYAENTIGSHIKRLKIFMNEAFENKLTTNLDFKSVRFKKPHENSEKIYLNLDEIKKLYELDLSSNKRLDNVRDLFLIGCYTGLRFSDLSKITTDNFINKKTQLKVKTEKTGEVVVIPLHNVVKDIVHKHNNSIPKVISNQKMNEYLKEVALLAELKDKVSIPITKGGIKQINVYEKWELVTVHTARRSFATNMYLLDIPTISIMKITGHKTERAFMQYIKITQEENANKLLNHPFFKS